MAHPVSDKQPEHSGASAANSILIVEDESIIAMELSERLQNLGYRVVAIAHNGPEAIAKADELRPDLVLMDIYLKGEMDGVEAATTINNRYDAPVIYLTANTDEQTFQRAKVTEPYGYLLKPFAERELHTTIEIALYKAATERDLAQYRQELEEALSEQSRLVDQAPGGAGQGQNLERPGADLRRLQKCSGRQGVLGTNRKLYPRQLRG